MSFFRSALAEYPIKVMKEAKEHMEYISKTPKSFYYGSEYFALGNKLDKRFSNLLALVEKPEHMGLDTFGFRKDFPLASAFSHHIWRVREAGVIDRVKKKYLAAALALGSKHDQWVPLSIYALVTPFLFFCAASVVCSIVCLFEVATLLRHGL